MKRAKQLIKKMGRYYINGYYKLNKPLIDNGIIPFM